MPIHVSSAISKSTIQTTRRTLALVIAPALLLLASGAIRTGSVEAEAPRTVAEVETLFGCPGTLVVANVDCNQHFTTVNAATPAPDFSRYGCAGGSQPLAPWCNNTIQSDQP